MGLLSLSQRYRRTFTFLASTKVPFAHVVPCPLCSHNAISEGAARFYLSHTIRPRPLKFDLGVSTSVDWSSNWQKGMDREIFTSVSGKRFILGKWTAVVPKVSSLPFWPPLLRNSSRNETSRELSLIRW